MVLHGKVCFHLFASNEVNLTHFLISVVLVATIVPKFDQRFVVLFRRLVPQNQNLSCKETEEDENLFCCYLQCHEYLSDFGYDIFYLFATLISTLIALTGVTNAHVP